MPEKTEFRPALATPETMVPFLEHLDPGDDSFPLERQARELEASLRELSNALRAGSTALPALARTLLDSSFRGARLLPDPPSTAQTGLVVARTTTLAADLTLDARSFGAEMQRLVANFRDLTVAELLLTSMTAEGTAGSPSQRLRTTVRYDLVGAAKNAYRAEHVGEWDMTWQRNGSGWQVVRWTAASDVASQARAPVFNEITATALGGTDSFRKQLSLDLDTWMATFDSVLTRDSNGHHGVSAGDADGDGRDDLYVAQPAGLPNRLYRSRGDSTFEDITETSGLGVLDDTAQSLFADIDNDGDQDLVLATATAPLLFINDGKAHFAPARDAFRFAGPLQGVLTSMSMADYDRDGFLDLYLCVYSTSSEPARTRREPRRRTTTRVTVRLVSFFAMTGTADSST